MAITEIRPFEATRTERGLAQAAVKRKHRWEKIAHEASQQARRVHLPQIFEATSYDHALTTDANVKLMLDEDSQTPIGKCLPEKREASDCIAILLGPEGGWTAEERQSAQPDNWQPCSLGATILRAETAATAGIAIIRAAWLQ